MGKKYTRKLTRRSSKRGGAPPVKKKSKTPTQALVEAHMGIYKKAGPAIANNAVKGAKHLVNLMGSKASEITKDWWYSVGRPGFMAQPPEYAVKQKKKQSLAIANDVKQIEKEGSIRKRLKLPDNIEISDVKRIYSVIKSQFKKILESVNKCDELMHTLKPEAIEVLSNHFIRCIDTHGSNGQPETGGAPWSVTEQIRQGCVMSVRKLKPYDTFKGMSEATPFMKLFTISIAANLNVLVYETIEHFVNQLVIQGSSRGSSKKKKTKKKKSKKKKSKKKK